MEVGDKWTYEHEYREGSAKKPHVMRWQTAESVTGTLTIPEGTVVLREVVVQGDRPGGWLDTVYGESNYLIRHDCLYFLNPQDSWDEQRHGLRPRYRARLLAGDVEPEFCFPLAVGKAFGKDSFPGWIPARVVGTGASHGLARDAVSERAFDVVVHIVLADETHLWFEKGVGITGEWDWHNGTYEEYRVRLLRYRVRHR